MQHAFWKSGSWKLWAAVGLSAGLLELPFPLAGPLPVWRSVFAWFALVPLLWALLSPECVDGKRPLRRGFLLGYLCGVLWFGGNCYWVRDTMSHYGDMPPGAPTLLLVAFSLYLGLYFGLFGFCVALVRRATGSTRWTLAAVPFLWVAMELAAARITSFPWDQLGYSQVDNALLNQLAPWTGVYGISFVLVAVNAYFASQALEVFGIGWRKREANPWTPYIWIGIAVLCGGFLQPPPQPPTTATAVLIQPNLNVSGDNRWLRPGEWESHIADLQRLAGEQCKTYIAGIPQTGAPAGEIVCPPTPTHPDLIAWPESPAPFIDDDARFQQAVVSIARLEQTPLVVGSIGVSVAEPEQGVAPGGYHIYNSALVVGADGARVGRYDKIHLFRFSQGAEDYDETRTIQPGDAPVTFDAPCGRVGLSICYDQWVPETTRALVWKGAEAIIHPTMTGTIDRPLELILAQANAISNQCYFVDVNAAGELGNGCSIAVGPEGDVLHQSGPTGERVPFTIDFDRVRHVRRYGTLQLGQVLKSFRDTPIEYPCYRGAYQPSEALAALGALEIIGRNEDRKP